MSELFKHIEDEIIVGDKVVKHTGDYQLPGTVLAVFHTSAGHRRFVVEHSAEAFGGKGYFLHIYGPLNIKKAA